MTQIQDRRAAGDFDLDGLLEELQRHAEDVDLTRRFPTEAVAALRDRGLLGALIAPRYGGLGLSAAELFDVSVAVGAGCGATGLFWGQHLAATAVMSAWGSDAIHTLLPSFASGERTAGIAVGHLRGTNGSVTARREGRRVSFDGEARWVTGATEVTDVLVGAHDPANGDAVVLGLVPTSAMRIGAPYQLVAASGAMTATITLEGADLTGLLLDAPPQHAAIGAMFNLNKSGRDAGYYSGLTRSALALCRATPGLEAATLAALDAMDEAAVDAHVAARATLAAHGFLSSTDPTFAPAYNRAASVMWRAAGLVASFGGAYGLRDGARHSRLAREAIYYVGRIPARVWAAVEE